MKVLVTGAGGMLGRAVVPALARAGHEPLALARDQADVVDLDAMRAHVRAFRPDWVLHLAAFTKVDDCESRPDHAHLVNAIGTRNAAQAAAESGAAVMAISTDYVFDGRASAPYREWDAANPQSVYGASKWAGEQACRAVNPRHAIVRTSWLYGFGGPSFLDTILRKAAQGESLRVVDDQRGSPTSTEDLAAGLVRLLERGALGTFHATNDGDCTWYELAKHALARAGLDVPLTPVDTASFPRPAKRPAYSVLSPQWFEHATGSRLPPWQDAVDRWLAARAAASEVKR